MMRIAEAARPCPAAPLLLFAKGRADPLSNAKQSPIA